MSHNNHQTIAKIAPIIAHKSPRLYTPIDHTKYCNPNRHNTTMIPSRYIPYIAVVRHSEGHYQKSAHNKSSREWKQIQIPNPLDSMPKKNFDTKTPMPTPRKPDRRSE